MTRVCFGKGGILVLSLNMAMNLHGLLIACLWGLNDLAHRVDELEVGCLLACLTSQPRAKCILGTGLLGWELLPRSKADQTCDFMQS